MFSCSSIGLQVCEDMLSLFLLNLPVELSCFVIFVFFILVDTLSGATPVCVVCNGCSTHVIMYINCCLHVVLSCVHLSLNLF